MTKRTRTPRAAPENLVLNATKAADLLGVGRTQFWKLRKQFDLQPVPWSKKERPLYRREDVLKFAGRGQNDQSDHMRGDAPPPSTPGQVHPTEAVASVAPPVESVPSTPDSDREERLSRARAKFIASWAHLEELPDFPSDRDLLAHWDKPLI